MTATDERTDWRGGVSRFERAETRAAELDLVTSLGAASWPKRQVHSVWLTDAALAVLLGDADRDPGRRRGRLPPLRPTPVRGRLLRPVLTFADGLRAVRLKLIDTSGGRLVTWRQARKLAST